MAKTLGVLTIHGMGETPKNYHADFYGRLRDEVGEAQWGRVVFKSLYYQNIIQGNQEDIFRRMRHQLDWMKLRKFLLYGFSDAATLEYKKEAPASPYLRTQQMILHTLDEVFDEAGALPLVIVAQSLGGQVISSYIWDAQRPSGASVGVWHGSRGDGVASGSERDRFRRLQTLRRLYTTGCNIPLFVAGHPSIEAINAPPGGFRWFNFFDEDDVLGWPLRQLSPSYDRLVEDLEVNAGGGLVGTLIKSWNPLSHEGYWSASAVVGHIAASIRQLS